MNNLVPFTHGDVVTADDMNALAAGNPRSRLYGATRDIATSGNTTYPATPDRRLRVDVLVPTWCYVQVWAKVTTGTGYVLFEWETEAHAKVDMAELTVTSSVGEGKTGKANMTTLGGIDLTGRQGWINVYLKTGGSGTVTLMGASAYSAGTNVDADQWSPT